jgi:hypothetical protein
LVSVCHCRDCQRRTGSAFGIAAFFHQHQVGITGAFKDFIRISDAGAKVTFRFCPNCGSTVFWEAARKSGLMAVAVGAFGDPAFPAPNQAVYEQFRHPWTDLKITGRVAP